MNQIKANVSVGSVILNDYTLKTEKIEDGQRLIITRGSEVQTLDLAGGGIDVQGNPGQVISFDAAGEAVPMPLMATHYSDRLHWDGDLTNRVHVRLELQDEEEMIVYTLVKVCEEIDLMSVTGKKASGRIMLLGAEEHISGTMNATQVGENIYTVGIGDGSGIEMMMATAANAQMEVMEGVVCTFPEPGLYAMSLELDDVQYVRFVELSLESPMFPARGVAQHLLPDSRALIVRLTPTDTPERYTADKTKETVVAAHAAGRPVYCDLDGILLPLTKLHMVTWAGGTEVNTLEFLQLYGGCFHYVGMMGADSVASESYGLVVNAKPTPLVLPSPADNPGKLFYANADGVLTPLALGEGLTIVNDTLTLTKS